MPVRCYSYIRFSTPEQARGDSLRRQILRSKEYAAAHRLILDESLRMTDAGVSAFDESNIETGALGEFLKAIERGEVPKGSYLLIEALDRLTRAEVFDALSVFMRIIKAGVRIVTLDDKTVYDLESVRDPVRVIVAIIYLSRGHNESAMKSDRGGKAWEGKRSAIRERRLTSICPGWLRPAAGSVGFEVIPERAEIVRWIYKQTLRGVGKFTLTKLLNERKEPVWGVKGKKAQFWRTSYIAKILQSPAVIGRLQPHKMVRVKGQKKKRVPEGESLEEYFPAVVSKEDYYEVQARRRPQSESAGRIGDKVSNLFTHIAKCGLSGTTVYYSDKGKWQYLKSSSPSAGARVLKGWPYADFERLFLETIGALNIGGIFERNDDEVRQAESAVTSARAMLEETQKTIENLVGEIAQRGPSARIRELLRVREEEEGKLLTTLDELTVKANQLRHAAEHAAESHATLQKLIANRADVTTRLLLREEIKRLVERIDVFFEKPESPEELQDRQLMEQALRAAKHKGVKIGGLNSEPKRSFTITFRNGVKRTVVESPSGAPLVYEGDASEEGFQSVRVLLEPGTTPPQTADECAKQSHAEMEPLVKSKKAMSITNKGAARRSRPRSTVHR